MKGILLWLTFFQGMSGVVAGLLYAIAELIRGEKYGLQPSILVGVSLLCLCASYWLKPDSTK